MRGGRGVRSGGARARPPASATACPPSSSRRLSARRRAIGGAQRATRERVQPGAAREGVLSPPHPSPFPSFSLALPVPSSHPPPFFLPLSPSLLPFPSSPSFSSAGQF
eukprot:scaffold153651_cov31-Tisochrysis_lutea.AAC.4